ncbi:hypothetical protein [Rugosimonospora acidiphila]|uniref:hypothetical protein n=1 Tax=Rugosimonospora acidiphila TaxID=556531 RepID=UPI0031EBA61E
MLSSTRAGLRASCTLTRDGLTSGWSGRREHLSRQAPRVVDGREATRQHDCLVSRNRRDKRQEAGELPADLDPACLVVMLMAMTMAPTTLPHIIEGTCGVDPRSPEFLDRFAGQVAVLARHLGLG